jgi:hypothetical protein
MLFLRDVRTTKRLAATLLLGSLALAGALTTTGCSSSGGPVAGAAAYDGPPVSVDSTGREHVVIIKAPSTGWRVTLDQVREIHRARRVFITIRKPDPTLNAISREVDLSVSTSVPKWENVEVWARQVNFVDDGETREYSLAVRATASAAEPADVTLPGRRK